MNCLLETCLGGSNPKTPLFISYRHTTSSECDVNSFNNTQRFIDWASITLCVQAHAGARYLDDGVRGWSEIQHYLPLTITIFNATDEDLLTTV